MQWLGRALGSVGQVYKDINPATLTGAIDVIVVERRVAGTDETELACSPFHVRFGKLSVLRPVDKQVRIKVNDEEIDFYMKVGETGEAFFVFETEEDVPASLQTSPIAPPLEDDAAPGEPDFLDLNSSAAEHDEPANDSAQQDSPIDKDGSALDYPDADEDDYDSGSSRYASVGQTGPNSPISTRKLSLPTMSPRAPFTRLSTLDGAFKKPASDHDDSAVADDDEDDANAREASREELKQKNQNKVGFKPAGILLSAAEKASSLGKAAIALATEDKVASPKDAAEPQSDGKLNEVEELEESMRQGLEGMNLEGAAGNEGEGNGGAANDPALQALQGQKPREGHDVREEARRKEKMRESDASPEDDAPPSTPYLRHHQDLMLDMAGYKIEPDDVQKSESLAKDLLAEDPKLAAATASHFAEGSGATDDSALSHETLRAAEAGAAKDSANALLDEEAQEDVIRFTEVLLQSLDAKTLNEVFGVADAKGVARDAWKSPATSPALNPVRGSDIDVEGLEDYSLQERRRTQSASGSYGVGTSSARSQSRDRRRPLSISSVDSLSEANVYSSEAAMESNATLARLGVDDLEDSQTFKLKASEVGKPEETFEMSFCGLHGFGANPAMDDLAFADHQLTHAAFISPEYLESQHQLVVRHKDRYLTWDNAEPVLAALAIYRKSLIEHPEHHSRKKPSQSSAKPASKGWGLWWRGRNAESTTSLPQPDVAPNLDPADLPPSPRSLPARADTLPFEPLDGGTEAEKAAAEERAVEADPPPEQSAAEGRKSYAKTLRLTSDQLKTLNLKSGMNTISFSVRSSYSGYATCTSRVFLWEGDYQVVISDIDGTITKSDALGHVFTMIGRDWTHLGVAKLYTDIARNGYKMMYLTSRAIGQADTTREYLKGIKQNGFVLPEGPVIMSPDRLMTSLHREVIMRKPEVFKMACLRDIAHLFGDKSPFYAGFGNRITDALSYRSVDVPSSRIFTIDSSGEVYMELLQLAGYKSSYIHMTDLVDQMFPPINRKEAPEYTDFNFWRAPIGNFDLPDLAPPSPALSARSEPSRLGFPKLGNIASSLSRRSSRQTLVDSGPGSLRSKSPTPSSPLLQATLAEEPEGLDGDLDGEEDEDDDPASASSSMPGSLTMESNFDRYRRASRDATTKAYQSNAEAYKERVKALGNGRAHQDDEDEEVEDLEEGEDDQFGEELDFSSVPYL